MKMPPRTERRGGQWYYRRRVPLTLVDLLGFSEYRESLKTSDLDTARTRAALRDAEVAVELEDAKRRLREQQAQAERAKPAQVETLSPEALQYIREAVRAHTLAIDERVRVARPSGDALFEYESTLSERAQEDGAALARGEVAGRPDEIARITSALRAVGVSISPDAISWPEAAYRATEGELLALDAIHLRMQGQPQPTPEPPKRPAELIRQQGPAGADVVTLGVVAERLKVERKPAPATIINIDRAVKAMDAIAGTGCPVADLTREHVQAYKDKMVTEGKLHPTTIKDRLGHVRTLLSFAEDNALLPVNVAALVKYRTAKRTSTPYVPFDAGDLKNLFGGPVHAQGARPAGGKGEAAFWVPLLALHSGARREELCQLLVSDIKERDGIPFMSLSIEDEAGQRHDTKALKNLGSHREVPLHPRLVELGFLAYVKERRKAGDSRVFPEVESGKGKPKGDAWGKWFGRYMREQGIKHPLKVFHSFRSTLKTALVSKGAPLHTHDAVTGHTTPGVGASYVHVSLADKLAALKLVDFGVL